jgi:phage terminase large subunit-like protein
LNDKLAHVERIIRFIETLIVPSGKGKGKPFKLRPFQKKFIRDVYGPLGKDGLRIVLRGILSIGRKNGKTMLLACLILAHLVGPEATNNGEIFSVANSREQAAKVYKYAAQIVRADPELMSVIKVIDSTKSMVCFQNGTVYRAIAAEVTTSLGENPTFIIYDELAQAKNRELYDSMDTSMGARMESGEVGEQPLFISISTQSHDPNHLLSQLIDDGLSSKDPTTVCHLYEVPIEEENIFDSQRVWRKANPALADFRSLKEMKTAAQRAKRMPSFETKFRNFYLNQRVDASSPLIPRAEWAGCKCEYEIEKGSKIYLGLDLSGKNDLSSLVGVSDGEESKVLSWFWKPEDLIKEHSKRDRVPYDEWVNLGFIETTPGKVIQYEFIAEQIREIDHDYDIIGIAFDRWHIQYLLNAMENLGVEAFVESKDDTLKSGIKMVNWGQGWKDMSPSIMALETNILSRKLMHDGNPVLTWNISNAISESDKAGNRKMDKSKSRFRIDGAVSLCMAEGFKARHLLNERPVSSYEGLSKEQIHNRVNLI